MAHIPGHIGRISSWHDGGYSRRATRGSLRRTFSGRSRWRESRSSWTPPYPGRIPGGRTSRSIRGDAHMSEPWLDREALIVVKAYPNPSAKYHETVCVAVTTREEGWVRLQATLIRLFVLQGERLFLSVISPCSPRRGRSGRGPVPAGALRRGSNSGRRSRCRILRSSRCRYRASRWPSAR